MDFGEIVEPVSRAFWDNYDEPEENDVYEDPQWTGLAEAEIKEICAKKTHMIVLEGEGISEFASVLDNTVPLCKLTSGSCSVFDIPNSEFLVAVSEEKNLNLFSPIAMLMNSFLDTTTQLTTLSVLSEAQHKRTIKDPNDDSICYLRALNGKVPSVKPLETPNIITGVAAGVTLCCMARKRDTSNYIAYMESVVYDSCSTAPLIHLLQQLNVPCSPTYKRCFKEESNLYM